MPFAARLFGILIVVAGAVLTLVVYLAQRRFEPTAPWWVQVPVMAFFFVGCPGFGAAHLLFTRVRTDPDGLLIVRGLSKKKLLWSEIAAFGVHRMTMFGELVGPEGKSRTWRVDRQSPGTDPSLWVFYRDLDPANFLKRPVRWTHFTIPFHGWPYPAQRYLSELAELRDRLEALRQARSVPQPLSDPVGRLPSRAEPARPLVGSRLGRR
jgi:hypothetical protein